MTRAAGPHTGSRRNTPRGRCRSADITTRSAPGTHTVSERRRSPSSTAVATASGVVASGASGSPAVIRVRTNPGRTTITCTPVPYSASPRPCANASRPALLEP